MKAPRPHFHTSRLNVGGYGVTLTHRTVVPDAMGKAWDDLFRNDPRLTSVPSNGRLRVTPEGLEVSVFIRGRVQTDGVLTVEREPWAARHYRRAVMGGAGVYRLGLWAFLATRRGLNFTTPEPGVSVEPHTVRVRGFVDLPTVVVEGGWNGEPLRRVRKQMKFCTLDEGTVSADGALTVEAAPWYERQMRRAHMKAAGVYLAGLWALLTPGHTREHLQGAQIPVNTCRNLDAWAELGHAPPPPAPEVLASMSLRRIRRAYGVTVSDVASRAAHSATSQVVEQMPTLLEQLGNLRYDLPEDEEIRRAVHAHLKAGLAALYPYPSRHAVAQAVEAIEHASQVAVKRFLPTGRKGRAARRAFHAAKREVLRFLRRMVPRRAAHRPAVRAPRPLYAQGIPPAAPLAPPAL